MLRDELKIGNRYLSRIDGLDTIVKIDDIKDAIRSVRITKTGQKSTRTSLHYHVTDVTSGNKFIFKSQLRFHGHAPR